MEQQNKPMEAHEWLTHVYWALLSHTSWISSRFACFVDFLMVWAPSQKVTWNLGRKYNTAKTWKYNQQTSFSMAFDMCFQTLQHMPCAARFFTDNDIPSIKSHLSLQKVASFCTVPLHKGVQHLFDMNPVSHFQSCAKLQDNNMSDWNPLSTYFKWIWSSYFRTCWRQYAQSFREKNLIRLWTNWLKNMQ